MKHITAQIALIKAEAEMKALARKGFDLYFDIAHPSHHMKKALGQETYDQLLDDLADALHKALMSKAPKVGS